MSRARKCVTAVVAGAMTAGIGAANMPVQQEDEAADVDLAANSITIPILDIDTPPPVSVIRQIFLTLGYDTNEIFAATSSKEGTIYDLPGLLTNFSTTGGRNLSLTRVAGQSIGTALSSAFTEDNEWSLLDFVNSEANGGRSSQLDLTGFTGGAQGIGAGLHTILSQSQQSQTLAVGDIFGLGASSAGFLGIADGEVSAFPFDGFKAVGSATPIVRSSVVNARVGDIRPFASAGGALDGNAGLCLGSAVASCGGAISQLGGTAQFSGGIGYQTQQGGIANIVNVDFPNQLVAQVKSGQFSLKGTVGGVVTVGDLELGRKIPVDIEIPRTSSMLSTTSSARQQSIRDSFMAVPRKSASDNETGGRHRATPVRDAVDTIKKVVNDAVGGKHAAKDSED